MPFPFGEHAPEKDVNKVYFTFVDLNTFEEKKVLFDYLKSKGKHPMNPSMITDGKLGWIAIPLSNKDDTFGYSGIHSRAEQMYHGAKVFLCAYDYIKSMQNSD